MEPTISTWIVLFCRLTQTIGCCQMRRSALQICGRQHVSSQYLFLHFSCLLYFALLEMLPCLKWDFFSLITIKAEDQWDGINRINPEDFLTGSVGTPVPQTPPSGAVEVPPRSSTDQRWMQHLWSEQDILFRVLDEIIVFKLQIAFEPGSQTLISRELDAKGRCCGKQKVTVAHNSCKNKNTARPAYGPHAITSTQLGASSQILLIHEVTD